MVSKGDRMGGRGDGLGVWDGNAIKLDCDDCCTTINVIKFTELKKTKSMEFLQDEEFWGGMVVTAPQQCECA